MGWLANAFTWWNGASWGTSLFTRRFGRQVGKDETGNIYFQHKDDPRRRWVIYAGNNDGSRVPPNWQTWLRGTIDELPEAGLPPRREWQVEPVANLTGSGEAWFRRDRCADPASARLGPAITAPGRPTNSAPGRADPGRAGRPRRL